MPIPARRFDAVIFDLDGTLLDTIDDIAAAMNAVLEARGYPIFSVEEYKILVGDGIEEMVRRALAHARLDAEAVAAIVVEYRREYERAWRRSSRPYPEVPELLQELRRRRVKSAILSNKAHAFTAAMTAELLPGFAFDVVRGAEPGIPLKPDPAPALAVARRMGVAPEACVFLGDTRVDMQTAKAAGLFPVGALWGFRNAQELLESGAALLLASPLELLSLF